MTRVENLKNTVNELNKREIGKISSELVILMDIALSLATIADTLKETREFFCGPAERGSK